MRELLEAQIRSYYQNHTEATELLSQEEYLRHRDINDYAQPAFRIYRILRQCWTKLIHKFIDSDNL